jgi:hypothetical protein
LAENPILNGENEEVEPIENVKSNFLFLKRKCSEEI